MTAMTENGQKPAGFFARNALVLLLAGVCAAGVGMAAFSSLSHSNELRAQEVQREALEQEVDRALQLQAEQADEGLFAALGVSESRVRRDQTSMSELLATAFTWSSGAEFEQAREDIKADYGLREDSSFLTDFLPPSRFNEDLSGTRYYYIDSVGMTSQLTGTPQVEVVRVNAGVYEYAVLADVTVSRLMSDNANEAQELSQQRRLYLSVIVESDGTITDITGVPASGTTRTAR